jgi:type I restriction enzyme S subunit
VKSNSGLPSGWAYGTIADTGQYINGFAFKPSHWGSVGRPIIRIQNLTDAEKPFNRTTLDLPEGIVVESGEVLVSWSATLDAFIWRGEQAALNQHIFRVVPDLRLVRRGYLFYLLRFAIQKMLKTEALHGSTMKHINRGPFMGFPVPIAPLREQDAIVAEIEKHFTRLEAAVEALRRVRADLERYRASVLKAACEGRLVPTEAELARAEGRDYEPGEKLLARILKERRARWEADQLAKMHAAGKPSKDDKWKAKYNEPTAPDVCDLPALPEGWIWSRAEQSCDFITKGTTPSTRKLNKGSGEIPYIKVYNLTDRGTLDFGTNPTFISKRTHEGELARSRVLPGDVLMNIVGPPLGKVSIVPDTFAQWNINQAIAIFRPIHGLNRNFLSFCLLSTSILDWAVRRAKATAGQFNLTLEICRDLPLPVPPEKEQPRIVSEVERRLSVIDELEAVVETSLKRAERLRQAILKRAFEGKLVPQDPSDEPAGILLERIQAEREANQIAERRSGKRPSKERKIAASAAGRLFQ